MCIFKVFLPLPLSNLVCIFFCGCIRFLLLVNSLQDGAENGYGAKAQEILGQVRGRFVLLLWHLCKKEFFILKKYEIYVNISWIYCYFLHSVVEVKAGLNTIDYYYLHCQFFGKQTEAVNSAANFQNMMKAASIIICDVSN